MKKIEAHNAIPSKTWIAGEGPFADLTSSEFLSTYASGFQRSDVHFPKFVPTNAPLKDIDWRKKKAVSYVKNQGQCGSCWAFSVSGVVEGAHAMSSGHLVELSEQNIVDCSWDAPYNNQGCNGGDPRTALKYVLDNKGIDTEKVYPYEDEMGGDRHDCVYKPTKRGGGIVSVQEIEEGDEDALAAAVSQGPVSIAIEVTDEFQHYKGGMFVDNTCHDDPEHLNHAILCVGYGSDYWTMKNSWDVNWGWMGYITMQRGRNQCGLADYATLALSDDKK